MAVGEWTFLSNEKTRIFANKLFCNQKFLFFYFDLSYLGNACCHQIFYLTKLKSLKSTKVGGTFIHSLFKVLTLRFLVLKNLNLGFFLDKHR